MPVDATRSSVLLVTALNKTVVFFQNALMRRQFNALTSVKNAGEARRIIMDTPVDIVIIDAPLPDESGIQFAAELAERDISGVLLLVSSGEYEQIQSDVGQKGVLTLPKPLEIQMARQALSLLQATGVKLKRMKQHTESLEMKMDEIRLVNRAKLVLVEQFRMSETEAHRYIEKNAMDRCVKRREVAEVIIKNAKNIQR